MKVNRLFGFLCSFMPGAAQMYVGNMGLGLKLMGGFLGTMMMFAFMVEYFSLIAFMVFGIPSVLIWFYSFFDGLRGVAIKRMAMKERRAAESRIIAEAKAAVAASFADKYEPAEEDIQRQARSVIE